MKVPGPERLLPVMWPVTLRSLIIAPNQLLQTECLGTDRSCQGRQAAAWQPSQFPLGKSWTSTVFCNL